MNGEASPCEWKVKNDPFDAKFFFFAIPGEVKETVRSIFQRVAQRGIVLVGIEKWRPCDWLFVRRSVFGLVVLLEGFGECYSPFDIVINIGLDIFF